MCPRRAVPCRALRSGAAARGTDRRATSVGGMVVAGAQIRCVPTRDNGKKREGGGRDERTYGMMQITVFRIEKASRELDL